MALSGQGAASARTACSDLRVVYGDFGTRDLKEAKGLLEELAAQRFVIRPPAEDFQPGPSTGYDRPLASRGSP